mgnify:CR=1 FL=1
MTDEAVLHLGLCLLLWAGLLHLRIRFVLHGAAAVALPALVIPLPGLGDQEAAEAAALLAYRETE